MVTVNAEAIPDELKERDQWLMWDKSADTPRRPHWCGNFGISWSDPDDWYSFEEAVEAAQEHESWGIGYVFAKEIEEHPRGLYGALDLDGCTDENGRPREWLPSLQPFFDTGAYMERSPSGEGIHIPLAGFEPPEWWSDVALDDHEGVEAYGKKFFTFTGDSLRGSGDSVANTGDYVTKWLKEVYEEIKGAHPWEAPDEHPEKEVTPPEIHNSDTASNAKEIARAVNNLDARKVADKTIVRRWNDAANASGDNRAFYPTWAGSDCNGRANIVDSDGWTDTGTDSGSGGPLEMAAIDIGEISHSGCVWGDVDGQLWWDAVDHLRDLGFNLPEYEESPKPPEPPTNNDRSGESGSRDNSTDENEWWEYVRSVYADDGQNAGRKAAADALENVTDWMYVMDSDKIWVYDADKGYFDPWGEQTAHRLLETRLGEHYTQKEANEVIGRIQARNQTRRAELNARTRDSALLCVGNGVVNLETGEKMDHSPDYKFTRGLAWDYDPARADPEPVRKFLDEITQRKADRDTLLDHLAHGLMPGHPYRAFVMTYGPGANGKTQLGKLFRGFVGEENAASVELQDLTGDDSFATGGLPGAFINVGDDISVGEIRDTSIIKSLTGDGTVRANEKYEKQYEFENEAAMFFSANEPPRIKEQTEAISDRLYPVEMPYRFVDDPAGELERQKVPGIADDLLADDAAMRGLLLLAVKHAQEVIDRNGAYSMPEGPAERREMYEAASDPIKRFAIEHFDNSDSDALVLKDDAYTVYTEMCKDDGERPASADVFKRKVGQIASIDLESTRTRKLSPGDSREPAWRYVEFSESAREFMPSRLKERYCDDVDGETSVESGAEDTDNGVSPFGAKPLTSAAETLTGYVTVTAEVVSVETFGEDSDNPTTKAILKDESGAMDLVTWDSGVATRLGELEGDTVAIEEAEVSENPNDGTRQLQPVDGLTEVHTIQPGVGYTAGPAPEGNQSQIASAATDGGEIEGTKATVEQHVRTQCETGDTVTVAHVSGRCDLSPDAARDALETLAETTRLLRETSDGWEVIE